MQQMVFLEVAEKIRNQQEQLAGSHCQKFVVNGSARRILEEKSDSLLGKFLRNSLRLSSLIQLRSTTLILCILNSFRNTIQFFLFQAAEQLQKQQESSVVSSNLTYFSHAKNSSSSSLMDPQ
jgi:menaquinone-dependent protoporphyrinogen IX oxidase